jgi:predicted CopG family antitoxin
MAHQVTIAVDDTVYEALKPMIEQHTISVFLHEVFQSRLQNRAVPSIASLRGTLGRVFVGAFFLR